VRNILEIPAQVDIQPVKQLIALKSAFNIERKVKFPIDLE